MAIGREPSERGGVIDPADVRGAGSYEWAELIGVPVDHPLVSDGGSMGPNSIGSRWNRVITTPAGQKGPASDVIATPEGAGKLAHLDSWRDLYNFHGSPVPWLLVFIIAIVLLVHFSINASGHVSAGLRG